MKRIKMVIYGEPGVGKSVFASKAPKPFFITTDGNYEWLEEFGAKEEDHIQVNSWSEAKKAFNLDFDNYETIVVDLTEDLFKWCEHEYCIKNKLDHVSDVGYGKGYDTTRNEFFLEMCKVIGLDKHIIFIMHGTTFIEKDRRGVEHTKFGPSTRIPDKVLDMIEGRVRYFLRCYLKAEEQEDKTILKKRYLSLVPKENEFGIIRGIDENKIPHDIPLDFDIFADIIGLNFEKKVEEKEKTTRKQPETVKKESESVKKESETIKKEQVLVDNIEIKEEVESVTDNKNNTSDDKHEVKEEVKSSNEEKPKSNEDKIAAIKAKLAAIKNKQ